MKNSRMRNADPRCQNLKVPTTKETTTNPTHHHLSPTTLNKLLKYQKSRQALSLNQAQWKKMAWSKGTTNRARMYSAFLSLALQAMLQGKSYRRLRRLGRTWVLSPVRIYWPTPLGLIGHRQA